MSHFIFPVFGFENLASADPTDDLERDSSKYYSPDSRIFRFAILGLVYIITGMCVHCSSL